MKTITVSYTYDVISFNSHMVLTKCGKVINRRSGREVKKFLLGNKEAVYINSVATPIDKITWTNEEEIKCPF